MRRVLLNALFCLTAISAFAAPPRPPVVQGTTYGGQQPVAGAHVYFFTPGTSTGAASVSLLNQGTRDGNGNYYVTTDSGGNWTATGMYTCPSNANGPQPVFAYAQGGNPGLSPGTNNSAIGLWAYLGLCGSISTVYANITEVTTIAMAYSIAGFATDPMHISYSGTQLGYQGIVNAFTNQSNLVNLAQGTALSTVPTGGATVPTALINTLGDVLAPCVNSAGPTSSGCTQLFNNTVVGGTPPTDTAGAALNIAHQPASNVAALFTIMTAINPFMPNLAQAPNDFTIGLVFSGGGIGDPYALAIDGFGNAWVASSLQGSTAGTTNGGSAPSSVVKIASPQAMRSSGSTFLSGANGYASSEFSSHAGVYAIAVDPASQYVWVTTDTTLEELSINGVLAPGSPILPGNTTGFAYPYGLGIDGYGDVWVGATGLYEVGANGVLMSPNSGYSLGSNNTAPQAIAIDGSENVWVVDYYANALIRVSQGGTPNVITASQRSIQSPDGVAIDHNGNIWIANSATYSATEYSQYYQLFPSDQNGMRGFSLGISSGVLNGQSETDFVGVDGNGHSLYAVGTTDCPTANNSNVCVGTAELDQTGAALSGPAGYALDATNHNVSVKDRHYGVAIDGSGNEWVANTIANTVTELIGLATPVLTPLAAAVSSNNVGNRP